MYLQQEQFKNHTDTANIFSFSITFVNSFVTKHSDRLHMVTWNVATAEPPEDVTSLLLLDVQPPTDLYVIGWEKKQHNFARNLTEG